MFSEGTLLGSFADDPFAAEKITIEFPSSKPQPEGRYVLLQQNKNHILEVGIFSASFEGKIK